MVKKKGRGRRRALDWILDWIFKRVLSRLFGALSEAAEQIAARPDSSPHAQAMRKKPRYYGADGVLARMVVKCEAAQRRRHAEDYLKQTADAGGAQSDRPGDRDWHQRLLCCLPMPTRECRNGG